MKLLTLCALGALTLNVGLAHCQAQATPTAPAPTPVKAPLTRAVFDTTWNTLHDKGDWVGLRQLGRDWEAEHPADPAALFTQGLASYMMGDLDSTISLYEKLLAMKPEGADYYAGTLKITRAVKAKFPDLKLQPLQFKTGDVALEEAQWRQKGADLLEAKNYDEIEKIAAQLQKSNESDAKGVPHLSAFFDGLSKSEDFGALKSRIAAWRAARPKSDLARLASLAMWTDQAWRVRGDGLASAVSPDIEARMSDATERAGETLKALPQSAFDSPLAYQAALDWGRVSGTDREALDELFEGGTAKFPDYLPLYTERARHLLPRWMGEPGEWETMAKKRADQIGGYEGDVFYARIVWNLTQSFAGLSAESRFDTDRVQRGLETLQKQFPDSISVASARLNTASEAQNWKAMQQILASPQGFILDQDWSGWSTPRNQAIFAELRMGILGGAI